MPEPYTDEEIGAILRECNDRTWLGARDNAILLTLFDTGLRSAELLAMKATDLDWEAERLLVMGKGRRERIIRIGRRAQRAIDRYLRLLPREYRDPDLWIGVGGAPLTRNGLFQLVQRIGKRAGVRGANVHRWRHTAAHKLLENGMHPDEVQETLGHLRPAMTRRYTKARAMERATKAHERFSPADNFRLR